MTEIPNYPVSPGFSPGIVLLEPEIPQNTGNIGRTCAALGCPLHLVKPLGFSLKNRFLRRAGMDYWEQLQVYCYDNFSSFINSFSVGRFLFFSKKGEKLYHQADYHGQFFLIFGCESVGLPQSILEQYAEQCYRLPMLPNTRSLNLASAVTTILYEAFRQNNFPGLT